MLLTAPSANIGRLREGLLAEIDGAGEAPQTVVSNQEDREAGKTPFRPALERLHGACALLDTIGWSTNTPAADVQIDLRDHREALTQALQLALTFAEDDLKDLDTHTPEHPKDSEAPAHEAIVKNVTAFREFATTARRQIDKLAAPDQSRTR
jgi:hypothetical protein